jgi:hypothetical protein
MRYNPRYYRLDLIDERRLKIIDIRLKRFLSDYNIKRWPIDTVKLIKHIRNEGLIDFDFQIVSGCSKDFDAEAKYFPAYDCYLIQIETFA